MSDTIKKYLDLPGLQEYDKGVKNALNKKADSSELANYLTVANASATYATKEDLENSVIVVDSSLSSTSTNPVQNKVVTAEIQELKDSLEECLTEGNLGNDQDIYEKKTDLVPTCDAVNAYLEDFYLKLSGGSVTGDLSVAGSFLVGGNSVARYLGVNSPYLFIGTTAEYEAANTAGTIPVGTIVIITDDGDSSDDITTAVLGTAKLGYMILGNQ